MRTPRPLASVLLLVALAPAPAAAQAGLASADAREIRAYRLTMPKLRQLNEVLTELNRLEEADPAHQQLMQKQRELAALQEKDELTQAEMARMERLEEEIAELEAADEEEEMEPSIDAVVAHMEGTPAVAAVLRRVGLSAREAVVMQFAVFQAGFTAELLESGTISEIPADANAENVKFYQANRAAIMAMTALLDRDKE